MPNVVYYKNWTVTDSDHFEPSGDQKKFLRDEFRALAPTLFSQEYVQEFQYCFNRAPVVPFDEIKSILHGELAGSMDSIYEYIDPTPLASALIAQVDIVLC
uniref:Uncharacterized AarF domain-containing protein kinase At5g05200, chloroplastic n=1 Tax=Tanacetum cinerariifolium TaxID=118510 RepID=A0A699IZE7_TANCI|nr:uncharacterized AarF domain-containing protein kinase At5g05200, chloroplastic [Tanacetum cinerariifolium]